MHTYLSMKFALPLFLLRFVRSAECLSMPIREASQMPRRKLLEDSVLVFGSSAAFLPTTMACAADDDEYNNPNMPAAPEERCTTWVCIVSNLAQLISFQKMASRTGSVESCRGEISCSCSVQIDQQHQLRPTMNTNAEHCAKLATGMGSFFKNRWPNFKKRYCVQF